MCIFGLFVKNQVAVVAFVHTWIFYSLPQSTACFYASAILFTMDLECNLKSGMEVPPTSLLFYSILLGLCEVFCVS